MLPTFSVWRVSKDINYLRVKNEQVEKTTMIYLPSVNSPITEFSTIKKVFEILIERAKPVNMLYINVTRREASMELSQVPIITDAGQSMPTSQKY